MVIVNDDLSIYITRGDAAVIDITAEDNGALYKFQPGDVVRIKVTEKKNCDNVVLQKDFPVIDETDRVEIVLEEKDTKIGGIISKPVDYWYEITLNPFTNPQTIIGYDDDGAKIFKLFPEGKDSTTDITEEDIPVVDGELSLTSERPVQNQVVARSVVELSGSIKALGEQVKSNQESTSDAVRFTAQTLSEAQKAQARENIGAAAEDYVPVVAPRAQVRQVKPYVNGTGIFFEDVFAVPDNNVLLHSGQCGTLYGLQAHGTASTTQKVYKSIDGENWTEHASLSIDAANGTWYTSLFVDIRSNGAMILLKKTTSGNEVSTFVRDAAGTGWWNAKNLSLGKRSWLGNNNCIDVGSGTDSTGTARRTIIFGEYGTTTDGTTYSLWRSHDVGCSWTKVLELPGDSGGATGTGEIRHWHTVQFDPHTKHWWASAGDTDSQCRIYRSKNMGDTWELMFSGSQRERTCSFVFEQDCIYYGMDATSSYDKNFTKIVKIDKSKLDTDRANCREDVAIVDSAFAVYGLTRTMYPDGFIVWTQQEPYSFAPGRYILQFYDYATKKLYPIAYFDTSNIPTSNYVGFYAGSRVQHSPTGDIYAKPTLVLHQEKYGYSYVSTHIKINLTM